MKLVIVESPTKCETIGRYLGEEYKVVASKGHICDLSTRGERGLGVDINNDFKATYVVSKKQINMVHELKELARKADEVILATDPDREGEAIAWHLARELKLDLTKTKRLEFHEITRVSIGEAMQKPRLIDMDLVASQEARRIIDRIIGFDLSGLIKKRIGSKSAGRVQSATLKLIAEHDKKIEQFVPEEYFEISAKVELNKKIYDLSVVKVEGGLPIKDKELGEKLFNSLGNDFVIKSISKKVTKKESKEPFTTSTLQQEAFNKLKFSTSKTQKVAQSLYEGINVNGEHMGLITYMRTDSTRLSPTFVQRAKAFILEAYGKAYIGREKTSKKSLLEQDAHEAIRPTKNHNTPESVKQYLKPDQYNLYKLIYNRALGSLMKPKTEELMTIQLQNGDVTFELQLTRTLDLGYEILEDKQDRSAFLNFPELNEGDTLYLSEKNFEQKFTQPPAHYSEAKIVHLMEEKGIGRPSTYAATIETLKDRQYVMEENGLIRVTNQGVLTNTTLTKYFPDIINVQYTASMESLLDQIASGDTKEVDVLREFYDEFRHEFTQASEIMKKEEPEVVPNMVCPVCGSKMVYAVGYNGRFIRCTNKACKHSESDPNNEAAKGIVTNKKCEKCGAPLIKKKGAYGTYYICSNNPTSCDFKAGAKYFSKKSYSYHRQKSEKK